MKRIHEESETPQERTERLVRTLRWYAHEADDYLERSDIAGWAQMMVAALETATTYLQIANRPLRLFVNRPLRLEEPEE